MRSTRVTCATDPSGPRQTSLASSSIGTLKCVIVSFIVLSSNQVLTLARGDTMNLKLDGKVALVTGSSKGIGEGVARGLAREGVIVIVHGRNRTRTEDVAHDIVAQGGRAYAVIGDLTNDDDVQRLVDGAQAFVKPVDILVNNAGGSGETEDWTTTRPETWTASYDRNVVAAVRITSCLLDRVP